MNQADGNRCSHELVDHFFRHEYARTVSVLCRQFGLKYLETIEDSVQKALLSAMQHWPHRGTPESPSAWISGVARNYMIDSLRHKKTERIREKLISDTEFASNEAIHTKHELPDSLLQMMFVCCHPALDRQSQIALSLKTLCGFSINEIASGLLMKPETVKKRLQRARSKLKSLKIKLQQPPLDELAGRLDSLHHVLYMMFNEAYSTSSGDAPIRDDVCEEATRICFLLSHHPIATPASYALLALMLLHSARLEARYDKHGLALMLDEQDRSKWDQRLIQHGMIWLKKASVPCSRYHLEAYLAVQHVSVNNINETQWTTVIALYDQLIAMQNSPVYRLNRAIAVAYNGQHCKAIEALQTLKSETFDGYYLLYCAIGKVYELSHRLQQAEENYSYALNHTHVKHQIATIRRQIEKKCRHLNEDLSSEH
ncbi:sigma-70 family RNA polymerase sigma factor [Granulosicoccus sp.]|nr:sigma-70 family RNA polymerase sigma factor [Granulosicoccus sp.]